MTTATFSNGKTFDIKNSKKAYLFAWYVENEEGDFKNGFSTDFEKAMMAKKSEEKYRSRYGAKITLSEIVKVK